MPRPLTTLRGLRRYAPWLTATALIVLASVVLTALGLREASRIRARASAIAGDWVRRMDRVLTTSGALREFRQAEAREALAAAPAARRPWARTVDSLARVVDGAIAAVGNGAAPEVREAAATARRRWRVYLDRRAEAGALPGGPGSAALAAFRERERDYRELEVTLRRLEGVTTASAAHLAQGSRAETRTVTLVVLASGLLTLLLAVAVVTLIRVDRLRRRAEQRWEDVAGTDLGVVWEVDARGRLVFLSEQAVRLLGGAPGALVGRRLLAMVDPAARATLVARIAPAVAAGTALSELEVPVRRADGQRLLLMVSGVPIRDDAGAIAGYRGVAIDVTQRRQAEAAAARAQRLDSLGTLAGGIAHDFNNVLHAIATYAELTREALPADHPAHADLRRIGSASDRGKRLVERILTFSNTRPRTPEPVDLVATVEEAAALLRPTMPPGISLAVHAATDAPCVLADPTELHQVVVNLLANATYAMRTTGGRLEVRVDRAAPQAGAPHAVLTVSDTGVGMPGDVLERIFEPFYTTKPQGEGTGIGLALVHGIVSGLGGRIDVGSTVGEGTTFTIRLPAAAGARRPSSPRGEDAVRPVWTGRRVLLVDDDQAVLDAVGRLLTREGLAVTALANPHAALESLQEGEPTFDLLLTDLSMPEMNGLELVARLRPRHPSLPVILCSGYGGPGGAERARALGIHALLEKPVTARELRAAVAGALAA